MAAETLTKVEKPDVINNEAATVNGTAATATAPNLAALAELQAQEQERRESTTPAAPAPRQPIVRRLADVEPETVEWLWEPYIPKRKQTQMIGDPGTGKTWLALAIAANVTRGYPFPGPDGRPGPTREPENVVYLTGEDGLADTLRPRLDAVGADVSRVYVLEGWRGVDPKTGEEVERGVTLADVDVIARVLAEYRPALLVVDPLQAYLGEGVDMHRANEVRPVLTALGKLADEYGCAVLSITHLRKSSSERAIYRGLGSIDFAAAARSILLVAEDPDDATGRRRVMAHVKSSLAEKGSSIAYELRDGAFYWAGVSTATPEALLAPRGLDDGEPKLPQVTDWLHDLLAEGAVPSREVEERAAVELGVSKRTLWRAAREVGVRTRKAGRVWVWELSVPDGSPTDSSVTENGLAHLSHMAATRITSLFEPSVPSVPAENVSHIPDKASSTEREVFEL